MFLDNDEELEILVWKVYWVYCDKVVKLMLLCGEDVVDGDEGICISVVFVVEWVLCVLVDVLMNLWGRCLWRVELGGEARDVNGFLFIYVVVKGFVMVMGDLMVCCVDCGCVCVGYGVWGGGIVDV